MSGIKLFTRTYGDKFPPLVILHGLFGQSDNWTSIARSISSEVGVILIDQRNHGQSPHSAEMNYTLMAADVKKTLDAEGIKKIHLLGHSMGGKTAMWFAYYYPEYLESLIIADIAPRYYPPHHQSIIEGLKKLDLSAIQSRNEADELLSENIPEFGVRQFLLKNLNRKDDGTFEWRFNLKGIAEEIEEVGKAFEHEISVTKTLFLRGAKSRYINEDDEKMIKKQFPESVIQTIPNAGHWLHAEQPELFLEALKQHLFS